MKAKKKKMLFSKNNQTALGVEISGFIFCFCLFVCLFDFFVLFFFLLTRVWFKNVK